ncbi:c-type cytochrome [Thiohalophilus thiocyanatoxydans]|uniref:Cbb3-type cytochrome c oxidase subunit III n=1 Tax=Thiohalophilus thiocyanatoxydans TaxID=381308 RepID=A0A4R8IR81_9GAMM|nr:cytochrome c [Thiohalophilus thiocyanatoxydans]TDY00067.1 hypothetical protein EDC23_2231 [Thiohalophilus thiocyanatoxydans]
MNNKVTSVILTIVFSLSLFLGYTPLYAGEGERLFQQHCSRCHQSASRLPVAPEKITDVLQSDTIKQHRFTLDEAALRSIVEYIKQQKS